MPCFHDDAPIVDRHKNVSDSKIRPRGDTKIGPISVPIEGRDAPIEGRDAPLEKVVRNRVGTVFVPIRLYIYCNPFYI